MKKLVLMAAAFVAVSFASCGGNKAANAEAATTDTTAVAPAAEIDTTAAAEVAVDTTAQDSVKVAE